MKKVKETYILTNPKLPSIPSLHDCVIKEVKSDGNVLVFVFENDISYHDSIKNTRPEAISLITRYFLTDNMSDVQLFIRKKACRLLHKPGVFAEIDPSKALTKLTDLSVKNLEYLYHTVGYSSMIIKLWSESDVVLDLTVDRVEYEWICK